MHNAGAIAGAVCLAIMLALPDAAAQTNEALLKVVIVNRHGVRTPTIASEELANWAAQPWPVWKEARGDLTARGGQLATLLGRYDRDYLAAQGVLPAQGCPAPGSVYIYADVVERTEETARGLAKGIAPGCAMPVLSKAPAKVDGIFHPVDAGVCRIDALKAQTSVLDRVGGDFAKFTDEHRDAFATLQGALGCCKPSLCTAFSRQEGCTLPGLPTALVSYADGKGVGLIGALSIGSVASEIFLLEYTDGRNAADVGWGRVSLPQIQQALALHDAQFDLTERTPYLARRYGSSLLARVAGALTGQAFGGLAAPDAAVRDAKLVAYVGHDTNIANVGGMLGMSWSMPGYQPNETPPAGALVFELREDAAKSRRIYAYYLAQSPDQMREATALTLAAPPIRTPIRIPACSSSEAGYPCGVDDFAQAIRGAIDADCVEKP